MTLGKLTTLASRENRTLGERTRARAEPQQPAGTGRTTGPMTSARTPDGAGVAGTIEARRSVSVSRKATRSSISAAGAGGAEKLLAVAVNALHVQLRVVADDLPQRCVAAVEGSGRQLQPALMAPRVPVVAGQVGGHARLPPGIPQPRGQVGGPFQGRGDARVLTHG